MAIATEDNLDEEPAKAKKRKYVKHLPSAALLCCLFFSLWFINNVPESSSLFHLHRREDAKEVDTEKEAAMEAELRAARERAIVPLEARMTQFKEMLLERGVTFFKCV